ncbi:MAG: LptF/LptG family permease [Candidatus Omnitrophica bacterium]|nr:LptF/LptG family permease [Candidatus Omnitrophota bacterium]
MRILKNYVLIEWFCLFILSLIATTFIFGVGNIFKLVELVIAKGVSFLSVFKIFVYLLPSLLIYTIPISILATTLLCFGRLSYENEIMAIRASGIRLFSFLVSIFMIGLFFGLLCLYFNDSLIPKAHYQLRTTIQEIGLKNPMAYLEEKTFIKAFQNYIMFIYKIRNDHLEDVRIYQPQIDKPTRTITAQNGEFILIPEKNMIRLVLQNGSADEPSFDDPSVFYKINFKRYNLTLRLKDPQELENLDKKVADMTIKELNQEIKKMQELNIDAQPLLVGLYRKFSLPFANIIFVLIAVPLAISIRRRERSFSVILCAAIGLLYYIVMVLGESLALRNKIGPELGAWLPNLAFFIIGVVLNIRSLEH